MSKITSIISCKGGVGKTTTAVNISSYTEDQLKELYTKVFTVIRVFMTWQSADKYVDLPQQQLSAPERNGFTVVEWGGTEIK